MYPRAAAAAAIVVAVCPNQIFSIGVQLVTSLGYHEETKTMIPTEKKKHMTGVVGLILYCMVDVCYCFAT